MRRALALVVLQVESRIGTFRGIVVELNDALTIARPIDRLCHVSTAVIVHRCDALYATALTPHSQPPTLSDAMLIELSNEVIDERAKCCHPVTNRLPAWRKVQNDRGT